MFCLKDLEDVCSRMIRNDDFQTTLSAHTAKMDKVELSSASTKAAILSLRTNIDSLKCTISEVH